MCKWGANRNQGIGYRMDISPTHHVPSLTPKSASQKISHLADKRLEIDENVIGARLIRHFLALK